MTFIIFYNRWYLPNLIAGTYIRLNWVARQNLIITLPWYLNYDLIKARSSKNTYTKIENW